MTSRDSAIVARFGSAQLKRLLKLAEWGSRERIVSSDVVERFGVSKATAKRDLAWLRRNGIVRGYRLD